MKIFSLLLLIIICNNAVLASGTEILLNVTGHKPLNTLDQTGFMDEVSKQAFSRIGYQLKTVRLPAERGLKSANTGLVDGEMSRVMGLEKVYANLVRVPEKIMNWQFVVFSQKDKNPVKTWNDLSGKPVAFINGWKILEKNIPETAEVVKTSNAAELFGLLNKDRTDYVIYELWAGKQILKEMGILQDIKIHGALIDKEMFLYLHSKHEALVPELSKSLKAMKQDKTYQMIEDKHLQ